MKNLRAKINYVRLELLKATDQKRIQALRSIENDLAKQILDL
jgi:hypothetical protein